MEARAAATERSRLSRQKRLRDAQIRDSSTLFTLPNGAKRSPDASWISKARWRQLSEEEREESPICPDFVIELRSESDRLKDLTEKMEEYIANGAKLGWLLDPFDRCAYIYRLDQPP